MTQVTVSQPHGDAVLTAAALLRVTGNATGKGGFEPDVVDAVTVSFDGGPPVDASLTVVPKQKIPAVLFAADVRVPGAAGPHEIRVVATAASGATGTARVRVEVQGTATPAGSLQVAVVNPAPPSPGDWAAEIVEANQSSIPDLLSLLSLPVWLERGDDYPVCEREWNQVTAPGGDYDVDTAGFSGWLLQPEISGKDVPFTHPFGLDWECMVALDPEYAGLLAAGNAVPDGADAAQAMTDAANLSIHVPEGGLLAVETDGGCVPSALKPPFGDGVRVGDRIAVFGRWIVDAAHHVDVSGQKSYRSEVHPPLLMAIGGNRPAESGGTMTRIVVTSRPYLVRQVYTTDVETIYDDSAPDDGPLLAHLNHEMDKLTKADIWHAGLPDSTSIEAHPKIASKPFDGAHLFRFSVRPPAANFGVLQVSFQFTCRSGVGVQVIGAGDHVDVLIALNSSGYQAPRLPPRQPDIWTKERLDAIDTASADLITYEQVASVLTLFASPFGPISLANAEHALAHGIETDKYDVPDVDVLDRSRAVPFVLANQIPAGQGVVIDDSQPYPVFGFIEGRLHKVDVVHGGEPAGHPHLEGTQP